MKVRVMKTKAVSRIEGNKHMPDYDPERQKTARKWAGNNRVACLHACAGIPHCCAEQHPSWDHLWKCFTKQVPPERMLFLEEISILGLGASGCGLLPYRNWKVQRSSLRWATTRLAAVKDLQWKNWKSGMGWEVRSYHWDIWTHDWKGTRTHTHTRFESL